MRVLAMTAAILLGITIAAQAQENDKRQVGTEGSTAVENGGVGMGAKGMSHKGMAHKKMMMKHSKSHASGSKM